MPSLGTGLDGTILTWNPGAERLFGHSAEEVRGRSISLLIPADRGNELSPIYDRIRSGRQPDGPTAIVLFVIRLAFPTLTGIEGTDNWSDSTCVREPGHPSHRNLR
jgi:PAS domain-containing protein